MKMTQFARVVVVLGLMLTVAVVGCRKKPGYLTPLPPQRAGAVGQPGEGSPIPPGDMKPSDSDINTSGVGEQPSLDKFAGWPEDAKIFEQYTVLFDFDSSAIKASEQSKVAAVADQMKSRSGSAVRVEGHCDERGTEEYNRALGERRAIAIREELVRLGVDPGFAVTLSYGEDRPAASGNDESAYRLNRRGVFILLTPPNQ